MFIGALAAGVLTTIIIEVIHKKSRVKQDAAIGIAFTTLFAIGVILISLYASKVDLDQECVLYGEIAFVPLEPLVKLGGINLGPLPVARMGIITLLTAGFIMVFYKQLLVSSFDPGLASSLGINATVVHYALMCWLSVVVVSAFESVGAILVVAMLIMPGATASLISQRLPVIMVLDRGERGDQFGSRHSSGHLAGLLDGRSDGGDGDGFILPGMGVRAGGWVDPALEAGKVGRADGVGNGTNDGSGKSFVTRISGEQPVGRATPYWGAS